MKQIIETWLFHALDSLFFRESRPMDSIGNAELNSVFPPSARTLIGAIRAGLGESNHINWQEYRRDKEGHRLNSLLGYGDDFENLSFSGVWIHKNQQRLYPVPYNIVQKVIDKNIQLFFLSIDKKLTQCDLGNIRLATLKRQNKHQKIKPKILHNVWLTDTAFEQVLNGTLIDPNSLIFMSDLLVREPRIGIAINTQKRAVEQGKLYQTQHIRLYDDTQLAMDISYKNKGDWNTNPPPFLRLGGEGRIASIELSSIQHKLTAPNADPSDQGIILYLLTPMLIENNCFDKNKDWQPLPQFCKTHQDKQTVWQGELHNISLTLHSAVAGKMHREGGWDLLKHRPRPVKSYTPAGSAFYCTVEGNLETAIQTLHGKHIGAEQPLGRGQLAVGRWI